MNLEKPTRDDAEYCVAVLKIHATQLEGEASTASADGAVRLRARAVQVNRVCAWLGALGIGAEP